MVRCLSTVALGACLVLTLLGCADRSGPVPDGAETAGKPAGREAAVPDELQFTAKTLSGQEFDGTRLAGRDAVLWFWAPWCPQCRAEAPHVAAAEAESGEAITFVGVAALAPTGDMRAFVRDYKVSAFEHLADTDRKVWTRFGVQAQPAYAFIDDHGQIEVVRGVLGPEEIDRRVAELMAN